MTQKVLILSGSVLLIAAGLAYIVTGGMKTQTTPPAADTRASVIVNSDPQVPPPETAPDAAHQGEVSLSQHFEAALNTLLIDVQNKAKLYRTQRATLFELTSPQTLGQASDINAHYQDVQRRVALLRATIDDIMLSFENANAAVEDLLYHNVEDEDKRQALLESWHAMKTEQVSSYLDFFDIEEQIITAQLNLMAIYDAHAGDIVYDSTRGALTLTDQQAQNQTEAMRDLIDALRKEQVAALQG